MKQDFTETLAHVSTGSSPSDLRITDMKIADIANAPMHCILVKLETNQGITGYGEVRDASCKDYALMLKSRLIGENPCRIDRIFRKIRQLGTHARGAGGVSGIEIALPTIGYIDVIDKTHLGSSGGLFLVEQILNSLVY